MNSITFYNSQNIECKIEYEDCGEKHYLVNLYVKKIDGGEIWTKIDKIPYTKIKKIKLNSVIDEYKNNYQYHFTEVHIDIILYPNIFGDYDEYMNAKQKYLYMPYPEMNALLKNDEKIPYHICGICDGICINTDEIYKSKLLKLCEEAFGKKNLNNF